LGTEVACRSRCLRIAALEKEGYNSKGFTAGIRPEVVFTQEQVVTRLIIDPATQAKLDRGSDVLEICNDAGKVLGHFFPAVDPASIKKNEPTISEEEIERRIRQGGGRELSAILADLEKRA
jgi:hypothetical protein